MSVAGIANQETLALSLINSLLAKRDLLTAYAISALEQSRALTRSGTYPSEVDTIMAETDNNNANLQNTATWYDNKRNGTNTPAPDAHNPKFGG